MMFRTDFTVFPAYCLTHSLSTNYVGHNSPISDAKTWHHSPTIAPISRHCADLSARSLRQSIPVSKIEPAPSEQQLLFYPLLEPCSESPKRSGTVYAMV